MNRTRAWRRAQDARIIAKWFRYRDEVAAKRNGASERMGLPFADDFMQAGRMVKKTISCRCSACAPMHYYCSYKRHGRRVEYKGAPNKGPSGGD